MQSSYLPSSLGYDVNGRGLNIFQNNIQLFSLLVFFFVSHPDAATVDADDVDDGVTVTL